MFRSEISDTLTLTYSSLSNKTPFSYRYNLIFNEVTFYVPYHT